eukprot:Sdes_comp18502_c0_seq1m8524
MELLLGRGLLALQGPKSSQVLKSLLGSRTEASKVDEIPFMSGQTMNIANILACRVTRCGYTGEDGFEISVDSNHVKTLAENLLQHPDVKLAGLGARDALRLEAGLCLYGNDIDETTTPIEAGLKWTIGKKRLESGGFLGSDVILKQVKEGADKIRIGLVGTQGAPIRPGVEIFSHQDSSQKIGYVTSGMPSPFSGKYIAMGYIQKPHHKKGTKVMVKVRNRLQEAEVSKLPFVETHYYKL